MNVLNIMQCTNLGGMEQSSLRLMESLSSHVQFQVISVHPHGPLLPLLESAGIPSTDSSFRGPLGLFDHPSVRKNLRAIGHDRPIIVTGPTISALLALPDKRSHPRVLMVHFHHKGVKSEKAWKALYWLANRKFDMITFPSDFVRMEAESIYPEICSKSRTIRNPVVMPVLPSEDEKRAAKERFGFGPDDVVIGNAGWLIDRKRFDIFIDVAIRVSRICPGIRFVIAGDGPLRADLVRQAKYHAVDINFCGWMQDMSEFYRAIDILLFNTDWDAYPTTPIEAMSYGLPVVGSAVYSGLDEALIPGTGILFGSHDLDGMASNVTRLAMDKCARVELGIRARSRIAEITTSELTTRPIADLLGITNFESRND
jgi:glycosyltransferase involved in cell wall biosynthesis